MPDGGERTSLPWKADRKVIAKLLLRFLTDLVVPCLVPSRSLPDEINRYLDERGFRPGPTREEESAV